MQQQKNYEYIDGKTASGTTVVISSKQFVRTRIGGFDFFLAHPHGPHLFQCVRHEDPETNLCVPSWYRRCEIDAFVAWWSCPVRKFLVPHPTAQQHSSYIRMAEAVYTYSSTSCLSYLCRHISPNTLTSSSYRDRVTNLSRSLQSRGSTVIGETHTQLTTHTSLVPAGIPVVLYCCCSLFLFCIYSRGPPIIRR